MRKKLENLEDNRLITPQMFRKFYFKGFSVPKFYVLPKIDKKDTPSHHIVACYSSPATNVEKFLATIFKALLTIQKSYTKNSTDLVDKLKIKV